MTTFIGFLRGINVGGKNKVAMADLRAICDDLGFEDVRTYIQSGNVIFSTTQRSAAKVETSIERALKRETGLDITVVVRTAKDVRKAVDSSPYTRTGRQPGPVARAVPQVATEGHEGRSVAKYGPEQLSVKGRDVYINYVNGIGRSKVTNAVLERIARWPRYGAQPQHARASC